jgi:hypothetical protein
VSNRRASKLQGDAQRRAGTRIDMPTPHRKFARAARWNSQFAPQWALNGWEARQERMPSTSNASLRARDTYARARPFGPAPRRLLQVGESRSAALSLHRAPIGPFRACEHRGWSNCLGACEPFWGRAMYVSKQTSALRASATNSRCALAGDAGRMTTSAPLGVATLRRIEPLRCLCSGAWATASGSVRASRLVTGNPTSESSDRRLSRPLLFRRRGPHPLRRVRASQ